MTDPAQHTFRKVLRARDVQRARWLTTTVAVSLAILNGCGRASAGYPEAFNSPEPGERIRAARHAAQTGDEEAIPLLVDRLEDEDAAVRFYAILALEKLTGMRRGYGYQSSAHERHRAVRRWRRWLSQRATTMIAPSGEARAGTED